MTNETSYTPPVPVSVDTREVSRIQVQVSMPGPDQYLFQFAEHYSFPHVGAAFVALREALTDYLRETAGLEPEEKERLFLPIKYASRVVCTNMPMIHNPMDLSVFIDPLQTVRDVVMEINRTKSILLVRYPSRSYYYRAKTPDYAFPSTPGQSAGWKGTKQTVTLDKSRYDRKPTPK